MADPFKVAARDLLFDDDLAVQAFLRRQGYQDRRTVRCRLSSAADFAQLGAGPGMVIGINAVRLWPVDLDGLAIERADLRGAVLELDDDGRPRAFALTGEATQDRHGIWTVGLMETDP